MKGNLTTVGLGILIILGAVIGVLVTACRAAAAYPKAANQLVRR